MTIRNEGRTPVFDLFLTILGRSWWLAAGVTLIQEAAVAYWQVHKR